MNVFQSNTSLFHSSIGLRFPPRLLYSLHPSFMHSTGGVTFNLWCLVAGAPAPIRVTIPASCVIQELKSVITEKVVITNCGSHRVDLWKLDERVPIDPDDTLITRIQSQGNISEFATKLKITHKLSTVFEKQPEEDILHIFVTFTRVDQVSGAHDIPVSLPSKRPGPPGEEYEQPMKSHKIDTTDCVVIHNTIKSKLEIDLADPETCTSLPFPSLLPVPFQHFEKDKIETIAHFQYMGRKKFNNLIDYLQNPNFLDTDGCLYVYGSSGSGKSHLLAALAYQLIREGKRVFYIPDCYRLLLAPADIIWEALRFAFHDHAMLGTLLEDADDVGKLLRFMSHQKDVYVIIDQLNALEAENVDREAKAQVKKWLGVLRHKHRYIFSASPNEASNREADSKQSGIIVFRMFGGMDRDETTQWFIHHQTKIPQLSDEQCEVVKYITGCNPLLLRSLIDLDEFEEVNFRNLTDLRKVKDDIQKFFKDKYASLSRMHQEGYLAIMKACIQGRHINGEDRALYDLRYFYTDENCIGQFTCGIAFETIVSILRIESSAMFSDNSWYQTISESSNPVVRGFLAEQVCLGTIARIGLTVPSGKNLGPMGTAAFSKQPAFFEFLATTDHTTCLFIPSAYNFKTVDGIIFSVDRGKKKASIFPIQFTLSSRHKQSHEQFHNELWQKWTKELTDAQYEVESTFVWIDKAQPSNDLKPPLVKDLKSGRRVVHRGYSVVHIDVKTVDPMLATALGIQ